MCPMAENVQTCPHPALLLPVVSMNYPPKPKNLQWVFSESSNPHRPGQGATAARASAKYVPGGCWFRKLMPGHPRQNEETGRNCFAGWRSKDFNSPCPTLLTQANQDLCDSQERKALNITLPTTVLTSPQCDHVINEVGGLQTPVGPPQSKQSKHEAIFWEFSYSIHLFDFQWSVSLIFFFVNAVIRMCGQEVKRFFQI